MCPQLGTTAEYIHCDQCCTPAPRPCKLANYIACSVDMSSELLLCAGLPPGSIGGDAAIAVSSCASSDDGKVKTMCHAAWLLLPTSIRMAEAQADENRSWLCATVELSWRREVVTSGVFVHAPLTAAERKAARKCPGSAIYVIILYY